MGSCVRQTCVKTTPWQTRTGYKALSSQAVHLKIASWDLKNRLLVKNLLNLYLNYLLTQKLLLGLTN